jgi:hypothetical protein
MWECDAHDLNDDADIKKVVLALVCPGNTYDPSKVMAESIDLFFFQKDALIGNGFELKQTDGDTAVTSLRGRHFDIVNLNLRQLGTLALIIAQGVRFNPAVTYRRYRAAEVKAIVAEAEASGLIC